jgi:hypothetical protein
MNNFSSDIIDMSIKKGKEKEKTGTIGKLISRAKKFISNSLLVST